MRQRKAKDLEGRMAACAHLMVPHPEPGGWEACFGRRADTYAEIGCGKGNFIIRLARMHPERDYVAIEGQETVLLRAMEKVLALEASGVRLPNLRFVCDFVEDARDFFAEDQLAGIYLNFSDPWPKARHAKRRLTYRRRLANYAQVCRPGGTLEFKTDNEGLYEFTLEEIRENKYPILEQTEDLHASGLEARLVLTEYEEKFAGQGKRINYVKIKLK